MWIYYPITKPACDSIAWHRGTLVQINNSIYDFAQAGKLAQDVLFRLIASGVKQQCRNTPLLFKHETRPINFILVVGDFSVKYTDKAAVVHLMQHLGVGTIHS